MDEEKKVEKKSENPEMKSGVGESEEKSDLEKLKKDRNKQNKQILWALVLMLSVIVIIVAVPFITQNYFNKFIYISLDFQKTQLGDLIFYSTKIPLANKRAQITGMYSMNFREDPRDLEYIDVKIPGETIFFKKDKIVYITLDKDIGECEDSAIAMINLAGFIKDFAGFNVSSGFTDETYANESGFDYVTCKNHPNNTVITVKSGSTTQIRKYEDRCYSLTYSECDVNEISERFILLILEKYMEYFVRG